MFRMYASNSHSYTHLILALGIVREPTVWVFMSSKYSGIHDIGLPTDTAKEHTKKAAQACSTEPLNVTCAQHPAPARSGPDSSSVPRTSL